MFDPALLGPAILKGITFVFMLIGLFGTLIPIFPGIVVIWLAALVYAVFSALAGTMTGWDWLLFVFVTLLGIFGTVVDNIILAAKLRETGTPWRSIILAYVLGLAASLFFTPVSGLLATPAALYLVEYRRLRDRALALNSTRAFLIGFGWTFLALFSIGSLMIGLWLLWVLF
jgi:uncharacterized protein YqgC (DUF456 family)